MKRHSSIVGLIALAIVGTCTLSTGCGDRRGKVHERTVYFDRDRDSNRYYQGHWERRDGSRDDRQYRLYSSRDDRWDDNNRWDDDDRWDD